MNRISLAVVLSAGLLLAGCATLSGKHDAFAVYAPRLTASPSQAAHTSVTWQLVIDTPRASAALDTSHIAVMPSPGVLEVYPLARWRDSAPTMLRSLILQAFDQDGRIGGVSALDSGLSGDYSLAFELRDFQIELADGSARAAIRLTAKLFDRRSNRIIASRAFVEEAPASGSDITSAVAAFEEAINHLMPQVVDWTIEAGEASPRATPVDAKPQDGIGVR